MIVFWIMTGLAAALAALLVLTGARRGADPASGAETQAGSREIEELDRLKARGLLDEAAYAGARAEAGRRLLAVSATTTPAATIRRTPAAPGIHGDTITQTTPAASPIARPPKIASAMINHKSECPRR